MKACVMAPSGGDGSGGVGSGGMGGAAGTIAGAGGGGSGAGGASGSSAPVFLSFSTSLTTVTADLGVNPYKFDDVVFSAVLTDPDGINDLIGGTLKDPDSGASYGSFATDAGEGAYAMTLTWDAINTVRKIEGKGGASRVFRAEFFDQAGHSVTRDVTLMFKCVNTTSVDLCNGQCTLIDSSVDNCGACGHACLVNLDGYTRDCKAGKCFFESYSLSQPTCAQFCPALGSGLVCDPGSYLEWTNASSGGCPMTKTTGCDLDKTKTTPPSGCAINGIYCICHEP
jgi:hypothetical protein